MRTLKRTLGLIILSALAFGNSMAQKASYTTKGGIHIGFGAGMAYQKSDLLNSKGYGFDFILGSELYKKENAFLSVDWKFRFLAGENKAYDHRINPDNTYSNIRYSFFTYDLELGLSLNRLRERTGIVLSGFAGAGITHGRTFTDLYDAENSLYDYSSIDPNLDSKTVYEELRTLSDGDFETALVNKAAFLPTAGFFIGYQLSPSFMMGMEFKSNFYLTEQNSFAGINLDNKDIDGSALDRNNYVSLGFRWNLRGGSSNNSAASINAHPIPTTTEIDNELLPVSLPHPSVTITDPNADSVRTVSNSHTLWAIVDQVSGPEHISLYQNGFPNHSFAYNASTKILVADLSLRDGENSIRIQAKNQTSTAEDQVIIIHDPEAIVEETDSNPDIPPVQNVAYNPGTYNPGTGSVYTGDIQTSGDSNQYFTGYYETGSSQEQASVHINAPEKMPFPELRFVNPQVPIKINTNRFPLKAEAQNVRGRNDVKVKLNGASIDNFSFNAPGGVVARLSLSEGVNVIEITAQNETGLVSESTSITYNKPVVRSSPPVINITSPLNHPLRTSEESEELRATVLNVDTKENITLQINGLNTRNFTFSSNTKVLTARVALRDGENVLTLKAQNESGHDVKDQVFIKETSPCLLPVIRSIDPVQSQSSTTEQIYQLKAEIRNISSSDQLKLTVNGNPVSFSFNNNLLSSSVPLTSGLNTLSVNAKNECGEDSDSKSLSLEEKACGPRINPGNSDWQFCLVTPSGTFSRDKLSNSNFTYSGPASSLYFMPIGGGGDAVVNGSPYTIRSGQYYLFTGNLNVTIGTKNPGSMGQWSVCIRADRAPESGNGNNRPASPCETQNNDKSKTNEDKKPKANEDKKPKANTDYSPRVNTGSSTKVNTDTSPRVNTGYSRNANKDVRPKASDNERSRLVAGDRTKQTRTRR